MVFNLNVQKILKTITNNKKNVTERTTVTCVYTVQRTDYGLRSAVLRSAVSTVSVYCVPTTRHPPTNSEDRDNNDDDV